MKPVLSFLILFSVCIHSYGQTPIHDRAIVAQQERMVFKQWDEDKFYPEPKRFLGIPTNPIWYITWGLHPNYPDLDRRPLSSRGEQTQRLGLAAAMQISSNYYKQHSDTVKNLAAAEMARISGAFSSTSASLASTINTVTSSTAQRIMTDAKGLILDVPAAPSGEGLFLNHPYMGFYNNSEFTAFISASGGFLFKADDDNLISFGQSASGGDGEATNSFVLKSQNVFMSGSKINMLADKFFLGGSSAFISGSEGNIKVSGSKIELETPKFFMGSEATQFISGSEGKLTISSSRFIASPAGAVTIGDIANEHAIIDTDGLKIIDGATTRATFGSNITMLGGTITLNGNSTNDSVIIDSDGVTLKENNNIRVQLASDELVLGRDGNARTVISDSSIAMFDGQGSSRQRVAIDNTGKIAVGGASNANVSVTSTDDVIRINPGTGVFIFDDSNNFTQLDSTAFSIVKGGHVSASFGTKTTIGPTSGSHVEISGSGVTIFSDDKTDSINITDGGVFVNENSQVRAIFGATTVLGSAGAAVTTTSTDDCIRIANGTVSIFQDNNNKAVVNSDGLTITQGGNTVGTFGANPIITGGTVTIRSSANNDDKVQVTADSFKVFDDGNEVAEFGATTTIGDTSGEHISIGSSAFEIKTGANNTVLSASVDGLEMSGSIVAKNGEIGDFFMSEGSLYRGNASLTSTDVDFVIDSFGIKLGTTTQSGGLIMSLTEGDGFFVGTTGDFKIGKKFGAGIKFDISESELTISSSNFNLTAEGNVTMSGDVSARKGTFRDIAVMGALVPNLSGSGSLNFVETWAPISLDDTGNTSGHVSTVSGESAGLLLNSITGSTWSFRPDNDNLDTPVTFTDGKTADQATLGFKESSGESGESSAAPDPLKKDFRATWELEGQTEGPSDRDKRALYDANYLKNEKSSTFGINGGVPKIGINWAQPHDGGSLKENFVELTSGVIGLPLRQDDIFECVLEFSSRDVGSFGGFFSNFQFQVYEDDDTLLYTEVKQHSGRISKWTNWSIPLVQSAGLVSLKSAGSGAGAAFDIKDKIYFKMKIGFFTATDGSTGNTSAGGGTFHGSALTEMRMRRAPFIPQLDLQTLTIDKIRNRVVESAINIEDNTNFTGTTNTVTGIVDITGTTDATDATGDTGILRVEGGASIAKKVFVGTDLSVGGDASVTGHFTGGGLRGYYFFGESSLFTATRYLDMAHAVQTNSADAIPLIRDGSITGISTNYTVGSVTMNVTSSTFSTVTLQVRINNVTKKTMTLISNSTGQKNTRTTQAINTSGDTFSAGDVLQVSIDISNDNTGGTPSAVQYDDMTCYVEITYDD